MTKMDSEIRNDSIYQAASSPWLHYDSWQDLRKNKANNS